MPNKTGDDFDKAISAHIRALAAAKRVTAANIADRLGMSPNTFYRYWRGERTMRLRDLIAVLDILDSTLAEAEPQILRRYEAGDYAD